jgi:stearoyl-CoA desaturase (delta-9 desaturase)
MTLKRHIEQQLQSHSFGPHDKELLFFTPDQVTHQVEQNGKPWLMIDGYIVNVGDEALVHLHPGGAAILRKWHGRDATKAFHGGLNRHTEAAMMWMQTLRVGRLNDERMKEE